MTGIALPPPIDRFVAAVNAGDTAGFLACFTADARLNDWGRRFAGQNEIRQWSDAEFIGARGRLTPLRLDQAAGLLVLYGHWASKVFTGNSNFSFDIHDGLIREMRITG